MNFRTVAGGLAIVLATSACADRPSPHDADTVIDGRTVTFGWNRFAHEYQLRVDGQSYSLSCDARTDSLDWMRVFVIDRPTAFGVYGVYANRPDAERIFPQLQQDCDRWVARIDAQKSRNAYSSQP